jgi:phosphate-selective porin OprO and OprP
MTGVPTIDLGGGFTIKPRARLHLDYGDLSGPAGSSARTEGPGIALRRLRFGAEGDLPGDFSYRLDADFSDDFVEVVDAWVRYRTGPVSITVGQQNIGQSLEELTSSNDLSFMERAAFTDAFGFDRRLGVQVEYAHGPLVVQAGIATENLLGLGDGVENKLGANARVVFAPRIGSTQLHFGAHANIRDYADGGRGIRYRQRAFLNSVDTRFLATPSMLAAHDRGLGLEAAVQNGRWHAQAEAHWNRVERIATAADPTFFGFAVEGGVFLTNDQRTYRGGIFRGPTVRRPLTEGGSGAIQLNARYDRLDLNDAGIIGGVQDSTQLSLIWWPVPQVRLMLNYARLDYRDAAVAIAGSRTYGIDAIGTRFQIAF